MTECSRSVYITLLIFPQNNSIQIDSKLRPRYTRRPDGPSVSWWWNACASNRKDARVQSTTSRLTL